MPRAAKGGNFVGSRPVDGRLDVLDPVGIDCETRRLQLRLRRLSLMMLQRQTTLKRGVAAERAKAAWNIECLEYVLTCGITEV
jgi:hypothetical protein